MQIAHGGEARFLAQRHFPLLAAFAMDENPGGIGANVTFSTRSPQNSLVLQVAALSRYIDFNRAHKLSSYGGRLHIQHMGVAPGRSVEPHITQNN